uniref:Uncharacterized protein n=1 Tax=Spongospora subterranea TaxID=70186 RepID=A0A0H5R919_9EUKA|eukprot:CRZ10202.1 hypothetical protein [Spongospora subterranea]
MSSSIAASSIQSEPEPPPSLFNIIPGGSIILQLPGSSLLLRGENLVRGVVASGLRYVFGSPIATDPEQLIEVTDTKYNDLHSAVQELVEMFDEEPRPEKDPADATGVDILRATKLRVRKLETDLVIECQARLRAESRIAELESIHARLNSQISERMLCEDELRKSSSVDRELGNAERELEEASQQHQVLRSKSVAGIDISDPKSVEEALLRLQREVDEERHHRNRAEVKLTVMKDRQSGMLEEQSHREYDKAHQRSIFMQE